jgi:mannose-6-phosphate isomerase-like protein (cupin superfamily)
MEHAMPIANWKTQSYNLVQSLLFANPHRVIRMLVLNERGQRQERSELPAPVRRIYETDAPPERMCLQTIQCVQHMLIPPGGRHVEELHIHPDAEELVIVTRGTGTANIGGESSSIAVGDVIYIPPDTEHEISNSGDDLLGVFFLAAPVGEGLTRLAEHQAAARVSAASSRD